MAALPAPHLMIVLGLTDPGWPPLPVQLPEFRPVDRRPDRLALAPGCGVVPLMRERRAGFRSHFDPVGRSTDFDYLGLGSA